MCPKSTYYQHKALLIAEASCSSSTESSDNETQVDFSQTNAGDDSASQMSGTLLCLHDFRYISKLNSTNSTCIIVGRDEQIHDTRIYVNTHDPIN